MPPLTSPHPHQRSFGISTRLCFNQQSALQAPVSIRLFFPSIARATGGQTCAQRTGAEMQTFPFMKARFPDPKMSSDAIIKRLTRHRQALVAAKKAGLQTTKAEGEPDKQKWMDGQDDARLPVSERQVIERRADLISRRHSATTGLSHLKSDDTKKLEVLRQGVRLARVATEHHADELAAALHAEYPWMGPATDAVWHGMRRSVREGDIGLRLPPMLLDGPPGIGKSAWARSLGELIKVPTMVYEATVKNASFGLVGAQRNWGNSNPGRLLGSRLVNHQSQNNTTAARAMAEKKTLGHLS
jgi:hypothetical protein